MTDFAPGTDLHACARIVEQGDPDRFAAAMAAPLAARAVLFPLYAFNVEVARAPWVTQEPMIAQMRLQWWADVLTEIEAGGPVRRHEVATPLAVIGAQAAGRLQQLVEARRLDTERAPFDDAAALDAYLADTAGGLAMAAAQALGAQATDSLAPWGRAAGFVRYMQAVPDLEARGKQPLPDGRAETIADMARAHLEVLEPRGIRRLRAALGPDAGAAAIEFWQVEPLLRLISAEPGRVADGTVTLSDFAKRWRLMRAAF
ncbi:squalene/phytoene synthase family protein [Aestuariicoccus sp. MJ-SS9]|uniref:squalene/phytoene synthase family protein n=1 Tax=Aestuariicoccus sp. MJ-SS9 TaxID=3079855 RepID=UPI00291292AC|nr:squalene/phytoene synthase family protein [Aestuariicoccus sp. MJ-SS9]MDU8911047.1 squalene/phytoene synthase family protein [Aestuariicoccus sp. MJ-SS9]